MTLSAYGSDWAIAQTRSGPCSRVSRTLEVARGRPAEHPDHGLVDSNLAGLQALSRPRYARPQAWMHVPDVVPDLVNRWFGVRVPPPALIFCMTPLDA